MNPVFIGGAWPYANGPLHAGQIAALLPGDVLARYYRQAGHPVLYVSGSDCHGTPIAVRAKREKRSPASIARQYHESFASVFSRLGFSYDCYSRTDHPAHRALVQEVFTVLLQAGLISPEPVDQLYCRQCSQNLPDRYVEGICPFCGQPARGDQCDACTRVISPEDLLQPHCRTCGQAAVLRRSEQFFFRLSAFQDFLAGELSDHAGGYRLNARQETARYLREGLQDRAATRDLDWGIPVPLPGYDGKSIYVWIDAVLGYLSASQIWSSETGRDWHPFWSDRAQAWYVHGKDNIPFHTLILPALLQGYDPGLKKPDHILSSEYLTLEGRKISTSQNWAVWADDLLEAYQPDSIRYFLLSNYPDRRDADFSRHAFISSHNGELLGAFGNLVHRTFQFVRRYRDGCTPNEPCDLSVHQALLGAYADCGNLLEQGQIKNALERAFVLVRTLNRYFDQERPWQTRLTDPDQCDRALATCLHGIANLSQILNPFLPFSCERIRHDLALAAKPGWSVIRCPCARILPDGQVLFNRLDPADDRCAVHPDADLCDNKAG